MSTRPRARFFLPGLTILVLAACAPMEPQPAALEPPPQDKAAACIEALQDIDMRDARPRFGTLDWVVMRYDLDGGGRASNVQVVASSAPQGFGRSMVKVFTKASFKTGVIRQDCHDTVQAGRIQVRR